MKNYTPYGKPAEKKEFKGRDFSGSGNRDFGGSRDFSGNGNRPRSPLHKATCTSCGESCEVPFKPQGGKPVLCNACFKRPDGAAPRRNPIERNEFAPKSGFTPRAAESPTRQFETLNAKLDEILRRLDSI